jgi:hypothetical protein
MSAPDRLVRRLRLNAGNEDDVRAVLPRIADGLRCASLPDAGGRVLLVRRLDLGRIPRDATAQSLSLLIERRVAEIGRTWVEGGSEGADRADCVCFPNPLEARIRLTERLARGQPEEGWYWKLAVPEYRANRSAAENLLAVAMEVAAWPEARIALPVFAAQLVAAGCSAPFAAAIPLGAGEALLRAAGISTSAPSRATVAVAHGNVPDEVHSPAAARPSLPAWLTVLIRMAGPARERYRPAPAPVRDVVAHTRNIAPPAANDATAASVCPPAAPHRLSDTAEVAASGPSRGTGHSESRGKRRRNPVAHPEGRSANRTNLAVGRSSPHGSHSRASDPAPASAAAGRRQTPPGAADQERRPSSLRALPDQAASDFPAPAAVPNDEAVATPWLAPTDAGGILFLLPILARLGIEALADRLGEDGDRFASRVCRAALRRLEIDADDACWSMFGEAPLNGCCDPGPPPAVWNVAELRPPKGCAAIGALPARWERADRLDALADLWLHAARRRLRRSAGIGLASLVLRPARLNATATHIDVHFRLRDIDLRVRRMGLDIDPGWLPWFGRVVGFHFDADASP